MSGERGGHGIRRLVPESWTIGTQMVSHCQIFVWWSTILLKYQISSYTL